jgi:hypothetical protein
MTSDTSTTLRGIESVEVDKRDATLGTEFIGDGVDDSAGRVCGLAFRRLCRGADRVDQSRLVHRRPPPCSGISSIKEGFRVKVKHLRCWKVLTRKVRRKVARRQLSCDEWKTNVAVVKETDAFGQETLRLQGFFSCRSCPTEITT